MSKFIPFLILLCACGSDGKTCTDISDAGTRPMLPDGSTYIDTTSHKLCK